MLIYSFAYDKDFVLYDWSLEIGDTLPLLALDPYSFPDIEYPVVVDYKFEYIEDENDNLILQKVPMGNITVREVSAITLLDGKEYKKWSFNSNVEYIEGIGCLNGLTFLADCYLDLIQPEAIPVCYLGEHLVCASRNGHLLYQMSESKMENLGAKCKCLNEGVPNDIEIITAPTIEIQKVIHNGQLYIIHEGKTYNIMGVEVKNIDFE